MSKNNFLAIGSNVVRSMVTGEAFPFSNPQEQALALESARANTANAIAAANRLAGRTLSPDELLKGVQRPDPRSEGQKITDRHADYLADHPQQPPADDNPHRRRLAELDRVPVNESREDRLRREQREDLQKKSDAFEAQKSEAKRQREFDADPRRMKAVAHAKAELQAAKFDASVTVREYQLLERRLTLAQSGDLAEYRKQANEWNAVKDARIDARAAEFDGQIAELRERKKTLLNERLEEVEPLPASVGR